MNSHLISINYSNLPLPKTKPKNNLKIHSSSQNQTSHRHPSQNHQPSQQAANPCPLTTKSLNSFINNSQINIINSNNPLNNTNYPYFLPL